MAGPVNILVCDFDRAICLARPTGIQTFLVQQARELCWSRPLARSRSPLGRNALPDPEPFAFDVPVMAKLLRCSTSIIYRNIKSLMTMNILKPAEGANLIINKDYRTWLGEDGSPMFSTDQVDFAKSGVALGGYRLPLDSSDTQTLVTFSSQANSDDKNVTKVTKMSLASDENVTPLPYGAGAPPDARSGNFSSLNPEKTKTPLNPPAPEPAEVDRVIASIMDLTEKRFARDRFPKGHETYADSIVSHIRALVAERYEPSAILASYADFIANPKSAPCYWIKSVDSNVKKRAADLALEKAAAAKRASKPRLPDEPLPPPFVSKIPRDEPMGYKKFPRKDRPS